MKLAPAQLPAKDVSPSNMMNDREAPAKGAACDYKAFVAAGKWRETLFPAYSRQELAQIPSLMNFGGETELNAPHHL